MEKESEKLIKGTSVSAISAWIEALSRVIPTGTLGNKWKENINVTLSPENMVIFDQLKDLFPFCLTDCRRGNQIPYDCLEMTKNNLSKIKKLLEPSLL